MSLSGRVLTWHVYAGVPGVDLTAPRERKEREKNTKEVRKQAIA